MMTYEAAARIARSAANNPFGYTSTSGFSGRAWEAAERNEGTSTCCCIYCYKLFKWLIIIFSVVIVCFYVYSYYEYHSDIDNSNNTNSSDWSIVVTGNVSNFFTLLEKKILPTNSSNWLTELTGDVGNFFTSFKEKILP